MEKEDDQKVARAQLNVVAMKLPLNSTTGEVREAHAALAEVSSMILNDRDDSSDSSDFNSDKIIENIAKNRNLIADILREPDIHYESLQNLTGFSPTTVGRLQLKRNELLVIYNNDVEKFAKMLYEVTVDVEKSVKRKLEEDFVDGR